LCTIFTRRGDLLAAPERGLGWTSRAPRGIIDGLPDKRTGVMPGETPIETNAPRAPKSSNLALILMIAGGLALVVIALLLAPRLAPKAVPFNDFYDYYIGCRLFWDGKFPFGVTPDFVRLAGQYGIHFMWGTGYDYPPFLVVVMRPLLLLPPDRAAWLWTAASVAALGVLIYLVARRIEGPWRKLLVGFYMLSYTPILYSIGSGQVNIAVLCLMSLYLLGRRDGVRATGLALASLIKVFPGLFVVKDALQRRIRLALLSLAVMAGVLVIPAILRGPRLVLAYFLQVLPELNHTFNPDMSNQSLNGMFSRLLSDPTYSSLITPEWVLSSAGMAATLAILAGLCIVTLRRRYAEPVLTLIWLAGLTLIAGRNMYWNFAPCVFIGIYLILHWESLASWQRALFIASALISNLLWHVLYGLGYATTPADLSIPRVLFVLLFSAGTISLVLAAAPLLGMRPEPAPEETGAKDTGIGLLPPARRLDRNLHTIK
jgi:Glycosyltransferase family 87